MRLAKTLEISPATFTRIELGQRTPKRSELLAIAEACEVPMWFLEGGWEGWRTDVDQSARAALHEIGPRYQSTPSKRESR